MTGQPEPAQPAPTLADALLAETAKKADLVWVEVAGQPARPMWHVWHDDAVAVVTDGQEQPDPGLVDGERVQLILRSKDKATRVLRMPARVQQLKPDTAEWDDAVHALHPKRLNAMDGEAQPTRWTRECRVWLLRADGEPAETPGEMSSDALRAVPVATEATTTGRQPFHAGRATKRRP
jgi:hypothetical protein